SREAPAGRSGAAKGIPRSANGATRDNGPSSRRGTRLAFPRRLKHLANLAVHDPLLVAAARIRRDDAPPETDCTGIPQILRYLPPSCEATQNELHRSLADSQPAAGARNEELRHPVIHSRLGMNGITCARHHRETHRLRGLENDEWECIGIPEPTMD